MSAASQRVSTSGTLCPGKSSRDGRAKGGRSIRIDKPLPRGCLEAAARRQEGAQVIRKERAWIGIIQALLLKVQQ